MCLKMSLSVKDLPGWKLWSACSCMPPVSATYLRVFDLSVYDFMQFKMKINVSIRIMSNLGITNF